MMKFYLFILLSFSAAEMNAQINTLTEKIVATRTSEKVLLDGKLTEASWTMATEYKKFMQAFPRPGGKPTENTMFKVLYDDEYIYVGVTANDTEPDKIVASGFARDNYVNFEDGVSLSLDTYNDKSHAITFYSNTLGARQDGEVTGNDNNFNRSFNTFWDVKVNRNGGGYTMEYRIPFSSLRFKSGEKVVMGFKLLRQIGRKNEMIVYPVSDSTISNITWRLSNETEIEFSGVKAKKPVYIIPYIRVSYWEQNKLNTATNQYEREKSFMQQNKFVRNKAFDKFLSNTGVDAKFGLSKNFTLDASLNTDFAQAEADNRIVNLTRFEINLPEKRNFFLEANDFLNFSIIPDEVLLFNSRNIGIEKGKLIPIAAGIRLTGKSNGYQVGLLNMQTKGIEDDSISPQNFSALRLRKDLFKNGSYAGVFFANRSTTNNKEFSNQTVAADYYHRINDFWSFGVNIATTKDKGLQWIKDKNNAANFFVMKDPLAGWGHFVTGNIINKYFNPESGFASDKGFKDIFILEGYTWQFGKEKKLNSILANISATYRFRDALNNYREFERYAGSVKLYYKNGSKLTWYGAASVDSIATTWQLSPDVLIKPGKYRMITNELFWQSATTKKIQIEFNPLFGNFYGGWRSSLSTNLTYNINKHFSGGVKYNYSKIEFEETAYAINNRFISHLISLNLYYNYDTKFSARLLWQYDNISKIISTNLRLRYNPREGTDLYIVYNPVLNADILAISPHMPRLNNQQVIIKFSTTINL